MGIFCNIIIAESPQGEFRPGSVVNGVVRYTVSEETTFSKIVVSLKGIGRLSISETTGAGKSRRTRHFNQAEDYANFESIVQDGDKDGPLAIGQYETAFTFPLPENVPSTLNYKRSCSRFKIKCFIMYYVRIKFEQSGWYKLDKRFKEELIVKSGITPRLSIDPVLYGGRKKLFQLFRRDESFVHIRAVISNSVLTPNDKLQVSYEIENNTNKTINSIETKIVEVFTFRTQKRSDVEKSNVVKETQSKTSSIKKGETVSTTLEIDTPSYLYSLDYSKMVSRDYFLYLTVELPMPHKNSLVKIPFQIGNIDGGLAPPDSNGWMDVAGAPTGPPPSYWDAVSEDKVKSEECNVSYFDSNNDIPEASEFERNDTKDNSASKM